MVEIYVDGSSKDNGKKNNCGGFGVCAMILDKDSKTGSRIDYLYNKQINNTTNNRMEMTAILHALELTQTRYKQDKCTIKSDSAYCVNMFNDWIYQWNHNGWTRYKNQPIENLDLVKQIWEYCKLEWPNFTVEKVKGHNGLLGNEVADLLATNQLNKLADFLKNNDIIYDLSENIDLH